MHHSGVLRRGNAEVCSAGIANAKHLRESATPLLDAALFETRQMMQHKPYQLTGDRW